jgi:magnesium transporter
MESNVPQPSRDIAVFTSTGAQKTLTAAESKDPAKAVAAAKRAGGFAWIGLTNPSPADVDDLGKAFGLHPLAVKDARSGRQQPKVQFYDEHAFVVMWSIEKNDGTLDFELRQIFVFAREGLLISVEHGDRKGSQVRAALENSPTGLADGVMSGLYTIMAGVVDTYTQATSIIEDEIEKLEDQVFNPAVHEDPARLYGLRKRIGRVNRAIGGMTVSLRNSMDHLTNRTVDHVRVAPYFRDLLDDLTGTDQLTTDQYTALDGIISSHENSVASQQNADSRRISAVAALIAFPAVIAGLYGMNFKNLPGVSWTFGWVAVAGAIVLIEGVVYGLFRRQKWL